MTDVVDWSLVRTFLAVFDTGSLSAGAKALGLTQPTAGRHIEALEQSLGGKLFTRSQAGLAATEKAHALEPWARMMQSAAASMERTASADARAAEGVVRLTASDVVGAEVLPAMLTAFRERHPGIAIELVLSNRQEDLLRRDADIAVRMARPTQSALLAKRIGAVRVGLFAHSRYLERHGLPKTMTDPGHAAIGYDRQQAAIDFLQRQGVSLTREQFALRTDNDLAQLAAVRAGFGIGACQLRIARRDPELIRVLADQFELNLETWLVMHEDLKDVRRVRLLFDHLADALGVYVKDQNLEP